LYLSVAFAMAAVNLQVSLHHLYSWCCNRRNDATDCGRSRMCAVHSFRDVSSIIGSELSVSLHVKCGAKHSSIRVVLHMLISNYSALALHQVLWNA